MEEVTVISEDRSISECSPRTALIPCKSSVSCVLVPKPLTNYNEYAYLN